MAVCICLKKIKTMREINREKGRVYNIDNHYYLEKIYDDLLDLINDEKELKEGAKKGGF